MRFLGLRFLLFVLLYSSTMADSGVALVGVVTTALSASRLVSLRGCYAFRAG